MASPQFDAVVYLFDTLVKPPQATEYGHGLQKDLDMLENKYAKVIKNRDQAPMLQFLMGCVFEHYGNLNNAIDCYKKAESLGMTQIPELYERRASCYLVNGDVRHAIKDFDHGVLVSQEAIGNDYHIIWWFRQEFGQYIPQWVGRPMSLQRGIAHFLAKEYQQARSTLKIVAISEDDEINSEHALWELASTFEIKEDYAVLAKEKRTNKELACAPDGLCEVLELYREPTRDLALKVLQGIELEMNNYQGSTAVSAKIEFYLGLYHHAFLKDSAKRNRWLKLAVDSGKLDKTLKAAATILLKEA